MRGSNLEEADLLTAPMYASMNSGPLSLCGPCSPRHTLAYLGTLVIRSDVARVCGWVSNAGTRVGLGLENCIKIIYCFKNMPSKRNQSQTGFVKQAQIEGRTNTVFPLVTKQNSIYFF